MLLIAPAGATQIPSLSGMGTAHPISQAQVSEAYGRLPLSFEINRGQSDPRVKFLSHGPGYLFFLIPTGAVMVFRKWTHASRGERAGPVQQTIVRMTFLGVASAPQMTGREELRGKSNYFIGNDPHNWRTGIPTYATVESRSIYSGVDVIYRGNPRQLEYDLVIRPGGDPARIVLGVRGAERLEIDSHGDLVLHTGAGALRQGKPVIYQLLGGTRRLVAGGYMLKNQHEVGFTVGRYDPRRSLYIDPVLFFSTFLHTDPALSYSTFLGGGGGDFGMGIAVDSAGNAYVTGRTDSPNFPTTSGVVQSSLGSGAVENATVTKLDPTGSALVYSTYLGGSGLDAGLGIAVDHAHNAFVTGLTTSTDFPTTPGAFQPSLGNGASSNAFVTKLDRDGSALVYSTYLGGTGTDDGRGIAVDSAGNAYVTGGTNSIDFPTTPRAFQPSLGNGASSNAFVTKLDRDGSALVYSTYLGGTGSDDGRGIAVRAPSAREPAEEDDPEGWSQWSQTSASGATAFITGSTTSTDFPTTGGAFQTACGKCPGLSAAFVTQVNATGDGLVYSTYLAGSDGNDAGQGIAVTAPATSWEQDPAYVTGFTTSSDFPTTGGAFQTTCAKCPGMSAAFVTQLTEAGDGLVYSTYLAGTTGNDVGSGIAVTVQSAHQQDDPPGWNQGSASANAYVTGVTSSADFPTTSGAFATTVASNGFDAFVTKLNPTGTGLVFSTYLGGSSDMGQAIAVDTFHRPNAYVAGIAFSGSNVPTTPGAFQTTYGGGTADYFVSKITEAQMRKCPDDHDRQCDEAKGGGEVDDDAGGANDDGGRADGHRGDADFHYVVRKHHGETSWYRQGLARLLRAANLTDFVTAQVPATDLVEGDLQYVNHSTGANVESVTVTSLDIVGNAVTFAGTCTNNTVPCLFTASVTAPSLPGQPASFTISVSGGPTEGGPLLSGSTLLQILQGIPLPPPPTATITVSPASIVAGGTATLSWSTTNATSATLNGVAVALSGTQTAIPLVTTTYTLVTTGPGGTATASTTLTIVPPPLPTPSSPPLPPP